MRRIYYILTVMLAMLALVACSDDTQFETPSGDGNTLRVIVPLSRASLPSADGEGETATEDERKVNSLRIFIFDSTTDALVENYSVGSITGTEIYEFKVNPGTYKVYAVANLESVVADVDKEITLQQKILKFKAAENLPQSGNLPMIYEPTETVTVTAKDHKSVTASMKFACVKVRYNLLLDVDASTQAQASFGTCGLVVDEVAAERVATEAQLGKPYAIKDVATIDRTLAAGKYYDSNSTLDSPTNETLTPGNSRKWLYQGVVYLPERYVKDGEQTRLKFTATLTDGSGNRNESAKSVYYINLGHTIDATEATAMGLSTGSLQFPRGNYYDIKGTINSTGTLTLTTIATVKPWEAGSLDLDFSHTELWIDKTSATVTSLKSDVVMYRTNVADEEVSVSCATKIDGKEAVIGEVTQPGYIVLKVNPAIGLYNGGINTAKVAIKAGNITKYIDVTFEAKPMFEVKPQEITIYWQEGGANNTKQVLFTTNLGGITIKSGETVISGANVSVNSTVGASKISISCDDTSAAQGAISVTATSNPESTIEHTFTVSPQNTAEGITAQTVKVIVRPVLSDYRIYFRVINDRQYMKDDKSMNEFAGNLEEQIGVGTSGNNWNDGWDSGTWDNGINDDRHKTYIYTQEGETEGDGNVWHFNDNATWPGDKMTGDQYNPGWYLYSLQFDKRVSTSKGEKTPKPAETLIMFSNWNGNGDNSADSYNCHRCPHHMEPGIPLFDYEDREGWILYDPTTDPFYRVYDNKPEVVDVDYTIYHKDTGVIGWYNNYGISGDSGSKFTIYSNGKGITTEDFNYTIGSGVTIPTKDSDSEYYLCGSITNYWKEWWRLSKDTSGKHFIVIEGGLKTSDEFKIAYNGKWDQADYGVSGNTITVDGDPVLMAKDLNDVNIKVNKDISKALIIFEISAVGTSEEKAYISVKDISAVTNKSYKKSVFTLKAVRGEYDKALTVKFGDGTEQVLFGGANFPATGTNGNHIVVEGYYDGLKWIAGKPTK